MEHVETVIFLLLSELLLSTAGRHCVEKILDCLVVQSRQAVQTMCLDLRYRAFAFGGQVNTEWS